MTKIYEIEDIIEYFKIKQENYKTLYNMAKEERQFKANVSLTITNLILTFLLLTSYYFSLITTSFLSTSNGMQLIINSYLRYGLINITSTNTTNAILRIMDVDTSTLEMVLDFRIVLMVAFLAISVVLIYVIPYEKIYTNKQKEILRKLDNIEVILASLYLLKTKWKHKLNSNEVKNVLSQFYLSLEKYQELLVSLITKLEEYDKIKITSK